MEKHKVKMRLNAFVIALLEVFVCISGFAQAAEQPSPRLTLQPTGKQLRCFACG